MYFTAARSHSLLRVPVRELGPGAPAGEREGLADCGRPARYRCHRSRPGSRRSGGGRQGRYPSPGRRSGASWRPAHIAALAGACVLAAAGCAAAPARAALPGNTGQPAVAGQAAPAALAAPRQTPQQEVAAAYSGYWQAYARGMTSRNPAAARIILAGSLAPGMIAMTIAGYRRDWAAHDIPSGGAVTHVLSVRISGQYATLHDCLDLSGFGVQDDRTGRLVPGSFGQPQQNFYITMQRAGGRWLLANMQPVVVPCAP